MEESDSTWSSNRNRSDNSNSYVGLSLYDRIRSNRITRLAENLSRNHGPLALGRAQEEGSRFLRHNINSVFSELGLMDSGRTREGRGLNLRSWIRRQNESDSGSLPNTTPSTSESTVIDFGNNIQSHPSASGLGFHEMSINNSLESRFTTEALENILAMACNRNFMNDRDESYFSETQNTDQNSSSSNVNTSDNANTGNNNLTLAVGQNVENAETEESNQDTQSIVSFLQKYLPFFVILLGKAIYDHRAGILIFIGLLVTFTRADVVLKREIAKQSQRSFVSLSILFINLFLCICFIYYVFQDQHLYKSLILLPPYSQPLSLWDLLWIVGITDFVLKFITIQLKAGVACIPPRLLRYSARGKWYRLLECTSQLYRGLVPIQPWLYYLIESYQGPEKVIGVFLSVAYIFWKGTDLMSKVKYFKQAFLKSLQNVDLGVRPSKEDLDMAGPQCPICHDDYDTPILLYCRHVFCDACVTTWFDREQTCPVCRTEIADDPTWKDGATTLLAQLF